MVFQDPLLSELQQMFCRYDQPFNDWLHSSNVAQSAFPDYSTFRALVPMEFKARIAVMMLKNQKAAAWILRLRNTETTNETVARAIQAIKSREGEYYNWLKEFRGITASEAVKLLSTQTGAQTALTDTAQS